MTQPTLESVELNAGSGGSQIAGDTIGGKFWQVALVGFSTGDGAGNVVAADAPLPVSLASVPAGTNLIGKVGVGQDTNVLYDGVTPLTVKSFAIACGSNGDNTLVAGVANKKIRLLSVFLVAAKAATAAVGAYWKSSGGTALSGDSSHAVALDQTGATGVGGFSLPFSPAGHFETVAGEALVLNLDAAQAVMGHGKYVELS